MDFDVNQKPRKAARPDNGRVFFQWLLESGVDQDSLANRLISIGHSYYGAKAVIRPARLALWRDGRRLVPLWAYRAAFDLCRELGVTPQTEGGVMAWYRAWCYGKEDLSIKGFLKDFPDLASYADRLKEYFDA